MSNAGQLETKTDKMHERSILLLCLTNNLGQMWTKAQKGVFIGPRYTWGPVYGSEHRGGEAPS